MAGGLLSATSCSLLLAGQPLRSRRDLTCGGGGSFRRRFVIGSYGRISIAVFFDDPADRVGVGQAMA